MRDYMTEFISVTIGFILICLFILCSDGCSNRYFAEYIVSGKTYNYVIVTGTVTVSGNIPITLPPVIPTINIPGL